MIDKQAKDMNQQLTEEKGRSPKHPHRFELPSREMEMKATETALPTSMAKSHSPDRGEQQLKTANTTDGSAR